MPDWLCFQPFGTHPINLSRIYYFTAFPLVLQKVKIFFPANLTAIFVVNFLNQNVNGCFRHRYHLTQKFLKSFNCDAFHFAPFLVFPDLLKLRKLTSDLLKLIFSQVEWMQNLFWQFLQRSKLFINRLLNLERPGHFYFLLTVYCLSTL